MAQDNTATAVAERTGFEIIRSPEQYEHALAARERFNVLTPFANISGLGPQCVVYTATIPLVLDARAQEIYGGLPFLKNGDVAIAKNGLTRIAAGLGVSTHIEFPSVGVIRHYWHVKAIGAYRTLSGAWETREASVEWDLRDGSDRLKGWTPNQISEARKNGLRACEARAINAMIRLCGSGIKQSYSLAELKKPFLAMRVDVVADMTDPEQRRAVTERSMQGASALFAQQRHAVTSSPVSNDAFPDAPIDTVSVGGGATEAASASKTPAPTPPKVDGPPVEGAVKIADAVVKPWQKDGRTGNRYQITDSNGVVYSTLGKVHYEDALKFRDADAWVEIITETNSKGYVEILEIVKAGSQPPLDGLSDMRT